MHFGQDCSIKRKSERFCREKPYMAHIFPYRPGEKSKTLPGFQNAIPTLS